MRSGCRMNGNNILVRDEYASRRTRARRLPRRPASRHPPDKPSYRGSEKALIPTCYQIVGVETMMPRP